MLEPKILACLALLPALLAASSSRAAQPIDLPGARAFPESITSTGDGTLYVGSLAQGGVLRIRPGGKPESWLKPGVDGTRSIFGVLADEGGHKLWLCSNDSSDMGVPGPSPVKGAWLKAFDLDSAELVVSAKLPGDNAFCNDIAIGPDATAYVTDSHSPTVLRLRPGTNLLEAWASDPRFTPGGGAGLDGIAFDAKGDAVVDLFSKGELYRIDVRDGHPHMVVRLAPTKRLKLPDAIRPAGDGSLLLVEGGGSLDRLVVDGDKAEVDVLKDGFSGPTGATAVGGTAWVAEGRLSQLRDPVSKLSQQPFRVFPVPIAETPGH